MKYSDIKDMSFSDLAKKRKELTGEVLLLKMKNSIGQLSNPIEIRNIRKSIARINTALKVTSKK